MNIEPDESAAAAEAGFVEPEARIAEIVRMFASDQANAAWLLCDRHPLDSPALTVVAADGTVTDVTFGELRERSERIAGVLRSLEVGPGGRVATLMGKGMDLVAVLLGIWRVGAVYVPLFTAFASEAIESRLSGAAAQVVVVDADNRHKLPPGPWRVVIAGARAASGTDLDLEAATLVATPVTSGVAVGGDGAFVQMFTSGTTGAPKGVLHPLGYVAGWQAYLEFALGVRPESVYWCGADPGWAYGLYTAVVTPLLLGMRTILQQGGFDAEKTWNVLADLAVTDYAAAPTVYRALRVSTTSIPAHLQLRRLSSAGEPLTAEVNEWAQGALGLTVHDHYGQTELGMVLGFPHHPAVAVPVTGLGMGIPLPGWAVTILQPDVDRTAAIGQPGRLAVDIERSPLMTFSGYVGGHRDGSRFTADRTHYLTGDLAARGDDAIFRFSSRDNDVIIMAGYRISPFDVESVLVRHPAVAECAVVAAPDPIRGEVIEAFVVLMPGVTPAPDLVENLQQWVRELYAAHAYPRRVHIVESLPKTPSGKIQRAQLRADLRKVADAQGRAR